MMTDGPCAGGTLTHVALALGSDGSGEAYWHLGGNRWVPGAWIEADKVAETAAQLGLVDRGNGCWTCSDMPEGHYPDAPSMRTWGGIVRVKKKREVR